MGKINPPRTPGNYSMRENISSTGGVNSSTIFAMLRSPSRRLFSRHALRVQQHVPNMFEKDGNFRLPDGWSFQFVLPVVFFPVYSFPPLGNLRFKTGSGHPLCSFLPLAATATCPPTHQTPTNTPQAMNNFSADLISRDTSAVALLQGRSTRWVIHRTSVRQVGM